MTNIEIPGHLAGDLEILPNGGVVLLSKQSIRGSRIVLAKTKRDFVTWHVYNIDGETVCEAGHYSGHGLTGLMRATKDYSDRR